MYDAFLINLSFSESLSNRSALRVTCQHVMFTTFSGLPPHPLIFLNAEKRGFPHRAHNKHRHVFSQD